MLVHVLITVDPSTGIAVHPPVAVVARADEVVWHCNDNFDVDFGNSSPFRQNHFNKGKNRSGNATVAASQTTVYKYTVTVGAQKLDPGVIIWP